MKNIKYLSEAIFDIDDDIYLDSITSSDNEILSVSEISKDILISGIYEIFNNIFYFVHSHIQNRIFFSEIFNIDINDKTITLSLNPEIDTKRISLCSIVITADKDMSPKNSNESLNYEKIYKDFINYIKNYKWIMSFSDDMKIEKNNANFGLFLISVQDNPSIFDYDTDFSLIMSFINKLFNIRILDMMLFNVVITPDQIIDCLNKYCINISKNTIFTKKYIKYDENTSNEIFSNILRKINKNNNLPFCTAITFNTTDIQDFGDIIDKNIIYTMFDKRFCKYLNIFNYKDNIPEDADEINTKIIEPLKNSNNFLDTFRNILKQNFNLLNNYHFNNIEYKTPNGDKCTFTIGPDKMSFGYHIKNKNIRIWESYNYNRKKKL